MYTYENIKGSDLRFFESMPIGMEVAIDGFEPFEICHGSMQNNRKLFYGDCRETREVIDEMNTKLLVCGHCHKCYELTSNGYLLTTNMIKLIENWYALGKSEHFWDDHDLSDLPEDVLKNVYLLKDANYINSTTSDLSLAFNHYIKAISKSSELRIILPIYSENHFKHIIDLLNNGKLEKLELIISEEIFNSISCNKLFKKKLIDNMNVKITVIKRRIKIFLTYSKEFMSLTLFFKDGHYDDSQILIAEDENAKKWASSLWNNYRKNYDTMDQCYVS
jgi:predicted transcriptional regulator